jgi:hypothetical protein
VTQKIIKQHGQQNNLKLYYFAKNMLLPVETKTFPVAEAVDFPHLVSNSLSFILLMKWGYLMRSPLVIRVLH